MKPIAEIEEKLASKTELIMGIRPSDDIIGNMMLQEMS